MNIAAAILVDGVIDASWLFIVAVGLTLVFGVLNILNFAHGSLFAVGAYTAASAVGWYYGGNFGPAVPRLFRDARRGARWSRRDRGRSSSAACCASSIAATRWCSCS